MSKNLGYRTNYGALDPNNPLGAGFWTVAFTPQDIAIPGSFNVYHVAVQGPASSQFQVFIDTTFYDYAVRGDINSWDPTQVMYVMQGQTIFYYWNTSSGAAPKVSIFMREPELI